MPDHSDMVLAERIVVGDYENDLAHPPAGLVVRADLGILAHEGLDGQVVHRTPAPQIPLYETRAVVTPGGDLLLMFPEGEHYGSSAQKANDMLAYRSSDGGKSWAGPTVAFDLDYNQHGFVPLIPAGSQRIYAFGTQPIWGMYTRERGLNENAPIGFRYSDDDGYHWSEVRIIRPVNDPDFRGMSVMRMCETKAGAWLLGSHELDRSYRPLISREYILRSTDQGTTWELVPGPRHGGWYEPRFSRMDELRPIDLGGGRVLALARTCEGHLWELRSEDDGKTWSEPQPTSLVHPDAPPMLCHLADGKTLVALHHNRHTGTHFHHADRAEIWVSTSTDDGRSWSEPRFLFANALAPTLGSSFRDAQCSYIDIFPVGDVLHLFVPHRWRQVLHLTLQADVLAQLPTRADLT